MSEFGGVPVQRLKAVGTRCLCRTVHEDEDLLGAEEDAIADNEFEQILPLGTRYDACAQDFVGRGCNVGSAEGLVHVRNVSFEPRCRDHRQIHHGIVIRVPAGTWYSRGEKTNSWFSLLAYTAPGEGVSKEWFEPVTDGAYGVCRGTPRQA